MPRYRAFRRRGGFGRSHSVSPVTQSPAVMKRKSTCRGCGGTLNPGETVTRLRLKKRYQAPCTSCQHKPAKVKFFHDACVPADLNAAMGVSAATIAAVPPGRGGAVAPPPPPQSAQDAALAALLALEHAVKTRVARLQGGRATPEQEKQFKTVQGLKATVLRPGSEGEGENATKFVLKRLIDMVF